MKRHNILSIHQISSRVIEIIENSKDYCFLVTPYFKPWPLLTRSLTKAAQKEKNIIFILRKENENQAEIINLNNNFGFDLVFIERLHTKLYLNEREALISSMNLYDSSKEFNYELGYYIEQFTLVKELKSHVIEDDLLGSSTHKILKGRYFSKLEKEEEEKLIQIREKERKRREREKERKKLLEKESFTSNLGFCIRCGNIIPKDKNNPMCMKCFQSWALWNNPYYNEKYCHSCGKENDSIKMIKPI